MSADLRRRHVASYDYPGSFFPESTSRILTADTFAAALAECPDEQGEDAYFTRDGWYAVTITTITEKRFIADDGDQAWVEQDRTKVGSWIVGERVHYTEVPDDDRHDILRSNIRSNSKDGFGVRTRRGNWQIADHWDHVVKPSEAVSR